MQPEPDSAQVTLCVWGVTVALNCCVPDGACTPADAGETDSVTVPVPESPPLDAGLDPELLAQPLQIWRIKKHKIINAKLTRKSFVDTRNWTSPEKSRTLYPILAS